MTILKTTYDIKTQEKLYTVIHNHEVYLTPFITQAITLIHKCK